MVSHVNDDHKALFDPQRLSASELVAKILGSAWLEAGRWPLDPVGVTEGLA